jgi:hypothetical protein
MGMRVFRAGWSAGEAIAIPARSVERPSRRAPDAARLRTLDAIFARVYEPPMNDVLLSSATSLRERLLARDLSSVELTRLSLARISEVNPRINAMIALDPDAALAAAAESDQRIARGEARALEGLPVSIKNAFNVVGSPPTSARPR